MIIKVLGSGCRNCVTLKENTETALKQAGIEAEVFKVTDIKGITEYGVPAMPALVINEKVVSYGRVLKPSEIVKLIENMG